VHREILHERLKTFPCARQVGFTTDFDQHTNFAAMWMYVPTAPHAFFFPARFAALRTLRAQNVDRGFDVASASSSAFLHSIMPAPVRSRSSFTSLAVIAISHFFRVSVCSKG